MALLLPDPCDPDWPEQLKKKAHRILAGMYPSFMGVPRRGHKAISLFWTLPEHRKIKACLVPLAPGQVCVCR